MSKKNNQNDIRKKSLKEYKKGVKRIWICVLCLIPIVIILTYVFALLKFPVWLAMLLNVIVGGFICLIVYIIFDKIDQKKKVKKILEIEEDDPFSD